MANIQIFNYNGQNISFDFGNGHKMINATDMAKAFGKQPRDFLKTKPTKRFINALSAKTTILATELIKVVNGGDKFGTWMHEKLALKFAGWLSAEFELWVYDRVHELITTGQTSLQKKSEDEIILQGYSLLAGRVKALQETNKEQAKQIEVMKPKEAYHDKVLQSDSTYTITEIANELGMTAFSLNQRLLKLRIQYKVGGVWILYANYKSRGFTETKTVLRETKKGVKTFTQTRWTENGRLFIHQIFNTALQLPFSENQINQSIQTK